MGNRHYIHKEFPKSCKPDDFWGQVKRTVNGVPVSQEQIDQIIQAIRNGLSLRKEDVLLDIGCGNGALSRYFFEECSEFFGLDFSEYLISIAKANFEKLPKFAFECKDASSYVDMEPNPEKFTKALCYGCLMYLSFSETEYILKKLYEKFINIETFYIGNLPDKNNASKFYHDGTDFSKLLDDNLSPLGIWRSKDDMSKLAEKTGWKIKFFNMPENFYSAHYRFDAILTR